MVEFEDCLYLLDGRFEKLHTFFVDVLDVCSPFDIVKKVNFVSEKMQCHIYTCPFLMTHYSGITNTFPGEIFQYIRVVSLRDRRPFEHEFFLRIQKSFPSMEHLSVINYKPQIEKSSNKNTSADASCVKSCSLNELHLYNAHDDYLEEFLFDTKNRSEK